MNAYLHQKKISSILIAVFTVGCGVLFLLYGVDAAELICRIAGLFLAAIGVFYVIAFFVAKTERLLSSWGGLFIGVLLLAVGVWMAARPQSAIQYMQYVIAIVILLHGLIDLQATFQLLRAHARGRFYALVFTVITLGLGVWILLSPMGATKALMILMGIVLITDGLTDLLIIFSLSRTARQIKKEAQMAVQEAEAVETTGTVDGEPVG